MTERFMRRAGSDGRDRLVALACERGGPDLVLGDRLVGSRAAETPAEQPGALRQERGPHLHEDVGEARLEYGAGYGPEDGLEAEVGPLPSLLPAAPVGPEGLRLLRRIAHAAVGTAGLEDPCVGLPRGHALHLEEHGHGLAADLDGGVEEGVVPGVAGGRAPAAVGTRPVDLLELGVDPRRPPAEAKREVGDVEPEVVHDPGLPAVAALALPVYGLAGVEVARVQKRGPDLDDAAELARGREGKRALRARQEGELG